jgi:hypothetical protein
MESLDMTTKGQQQNFHQLIEPLAVRLMQRDPPVDRAQVLLQQEGLTLTIAISLKRIADQLEALHALGVKEE